MEELGEENIDLDMENADRAKGPALPLLFVPEDVECPNAKNSW